MANDDNPREEDETVSGFSGFYRLFVPALVAFLMCHGASIHDATDLAQETMTKAFKDWRQIAHPKAWTRTVAYNLLVKRFKTRSKEDPVEHLAERNLLLPCRLIDPEMWEKQYEILVLLDLLPPRQREVIAWTIEGYTPSEIAAELQITPEAVRASLKKARDFLRKNLGLPEDE